MNIERIVAHLLSRNTVARDLQESLLEPDKEMEKVLSFIAEEWSVNGRLRNLYDWGLFEIPEGGAYCFWNIRTNQRFDVYLNNYNGNGKDCAFGYVDSRSVTQDAENSDEAIRNYSI